MANEVENAGGTATAEQKPKRARIRYGISDKEFAQVWNACDSVGQVVEKLSTAERPVTQSFVNGKASQMRQRGWIPPALKFMSGGGGRPAVARDVVAEQVE